MSKMPPFQLALINFRKFLKGAAGLESIKQYEEYFAAFSELVSCKNLSWSLTHNLKTGDIIPAEDCEILIMAYESNLECLERILTIVNHYAETYPDYLNLVKMLSDDNRRTKAAMEIILEKSMFL